MPARLQFNVPDCYRDKQLRWNGWGYTDSFFHLDSNNDVVFAGSRYEMAGKKMPYLRPWIEQNLGVDVNHRTPSQDIDKVAVPEPVINEEFVGGLRQEGIPFSTLDRHRLVRGHGHTAHDMIALRHTRFDRLPDIVVWPANEDDVVKVVALADSHGVAIIPIGGGTSVSHGLECPQKERRCIVSLDMSIMSRILWVDEENLLCRAEAGIVGQNLERALNEKGYTCGHEPDSIEFSTLGGWVSTRASGMKKNKYGNIEDLVVHVHLVTPKGIIRRHCQVPRISSGPDIHEVVLGSEGTLGVITEVTVKIFPLPEVKKYGSLMFPNFERGISFFREVARLQWQPASLRLVDNQQFLMGQALKVEDQSIWHKLRSSLTRMYVTAWKGFQIDEMVAATCVFEGTAEEVAHEEARLFQLATHFQGINGGEENGRYGYRLTFAIAYLRDLSMEFGIIGESFETSVPWDKVHVLCRNVKALIKREAAAMGVRYPVLATCRVTQVYDSGVCVYFYFAFNARGLPDGLQVYEHVETAARSEILSCGGSISHHHGVGKLRKMWMSATFTPSAIRILTAIKNELDPNNVFANGNIVDQHTVTSKL